MIQGRMIQSIIVHAYSKNTGIDRMVQNLLTREGKSYDFQAISDVTITAFEKMEISNHTEQFIIEGLDQFNSNDSGQDC